MFPWVIADWESKILDLTDPQTFRKLELPMGAQTPTRRREFEERHRQLQEVDMDAVPFHYGTHYSTAATVCGYLIRLRPYERILMSLQGGNFDLPDRTFGSLSKAWKSASELSRGDVRELIPEAFVLPEFLTNVNRFAFGTTQSGENVDDVDLPAWAHSDPMLFIAKHREALESEYISSRLHHWIDLIFGSRSRGAEAVDSTNVFHPLSYDDAVDLDAIESPMERQAAAAAIHSFGQTPLKLFQNPHPQRSSPPSRDLVSISSPAQLDFIDHIFLLTESIAPIRTLKASAHFIHANHPERAFASPRDYLIMPNLGLSLSRGHLDGSMRIFSSKDSARPIGVSEQMTTERIVCFTQSGPNSIVTGSADGLVTMWKIDKRELTFTSVFRGHSDCKFLTNRRCWFASIKLIASLLLVFSFSCPLRCCIYRMEHRSQWIRRRDCHHLGYKQRSLRALSSESRRSCSPLFHRRTKFTHRHRFVGDSLSLDYKRRAACQCFHEL